MNALPKFTEHAGHEKKHEVLIASAAPMDGIVGPWVLRSVQPGARVLDLGCGRGDVVAWLCEHGYDGYGVDIDASYIANGADFFNERGFGENRVRLDVDGRLPFEAESFDAVISNNVLEHVSDIQKLASELARVSRKGAKGLHTYPPRLGLVEGHMKTPLVHWLPKGTPRRVAIRVALSLGMAAPYFTNHSVAERAEIYSEFSDTETFYWSRRHIRAVFGRAGLDVDFTAVAREHARTKPLPDLSPVISLAGAAFSGLRHTTLQTLKT